LGQGRDEAARLGAPAAAHLRASPADPMHPLGEVHELEVEGEGARQELGHAWLDARDEPLELALGAVLAAPSGDGGLPDALDELVELAALLLDEDLAEHAPEQAHVLAEGLVFLIERGLARGHGSPVS